MVSICWQEKRYGSDRVDWDPEQQVLSVLSIREQRKLRSTTRSGGPTLSWKLTSSGKAPSIRRGIASGSIAALAGKFSSSQRTSFWTRRYGNLLAKCTANDGFSAQAVRTRGVIVAYKFPNVSDPMGERRGSGTKVVYIPQAGSPFHDGDGDGGLAAVSTHRPGGPRRAASSARFPRAGQATSPSAQVT
jgi:hypothetical protein